MTAVSLIAGAFLLVAVALVSFILGLVFGAMMVAAGRPETKRRPGAVLKVVPK